MMLTVHLPWVLTEPKTMPSTVAGSANVVAASGHAADAHEPMGTLPRRAQIHAKAATERLVITYLDVSSTQSCAKLRKAATKAAEKKAKKLSEPES